MTARTTYLRNQARALSTYTQVIDRDKQQEQYLSLSEQIQNAEDYLMQLQVDISRAEDQLQRTLNQVTDAQADLESLNFVGARNNAPAVTSYLSVSEYAKKYNKAPSTIYGYVKNGRVTSTQHIEGGRISIVDQPPRPGKSRKQKRG